MSDEDETLLDPDEFLAQAPAVIPDKKHAQNLPFVTPTGKRVRVEVLDLPSPAPVFHNTPDEAQINDDLRQVNLIIKNLQNSWKAVRTVEQHIALARAITEQLERRRKLANKQLGKPQKGGLAPDDLYHLD